MRFFRTVCLAAAFLAALQPSRAQLPSAGPVTNVSIDSRSSVFAILAAVNIAGYDDGLQASAANPMRRQIRDRILAKQLPVVRELQSYYTAHKLPDPRQTVSQYLYLALFVADPPEFRLTVPVPALPKQAIAVEDVLPLVRDFYRDAEIGAIWDSVAPTYEKAMDSDALPVTTAFHSVDYFLRLPQVGLSRHIYIVPDALLEPSFALATQYNDNYYLVTGLDVTPQIFAIRHIYLHYELDPLVDHYPTVFVDAEQQLLPQVLRAPALDTMYKTDAGLFFEACLVRAVEIQLDSKSATATERQIVVNKAMAEGLVLTQYWVDALDAYRKDVVNFGEFYPDAAFAIRFDEISGQAKHMVFAEAAEVSATPAPPPVHIPGLMEQGQNLLIAKDYAGADAVGKAALEQSGGDKAAAYFLLARSAAAQNRADDAMTDFQQALSASRDADVHIREWSHIYLARMLDMQQKRLDALEHYKAAKSICDTPGACQDAQQGIDKPFQTPSAAPGTPH